MTKNLVSAATIRAAYQNGTLDAAKVAQAAADLTGGKPVSTNSVLGADGDASRVRGRINPVFVAAFLKANPNSEYVEKKVTSKADETKVTLPVVRTSASGATLKRPVEVTMSEARRLSGQAKGRLGKASIEKAATAYAQANPVKSKGRKGKVTTTAQA